MNRLFILLLFVNLIFPRKTIVKIGTLAPEGTAWHDILLELGQKWKIASNGDVQLRIYPGGFVRSVYYYVSEAAHQALVWQGQWCQRECGRYSLKC